MLIAHRQLAHAPRIPATILPQRAVYEAVRLGDPSLGGILCAGARSVSPLPGASAARQREFAAGRLCAARAIAKLSGAPVDPGDIGRLADGSPTWPAGIAGSITHTRQYAAAVVLRTVEARALGFDAEPIMGRERADVVAPEIAGARELARLVDATGLEPRETLTLVFSAKEALFKCLSPIVGRTFDFHDATIELIDLNAGRFVARLLVTLSDAFREGRAIEGRVAVDGSLAFALVHVDDTQLEPWSTPDEQGVRSLRASVAATSGRAEAFE